MRRRGHGFAVAAAAGAVALALAGAALAALHGRASGAVKVRVTEREYHITLSRTSLPAGTVTFSIHNAGTIAHGFSVAGAGLKTTTVKSIAPGATRTLTVKLAGGTFSIWCPVAGHAALGMKASLAVKGAAASNGGASSGNTTTGSSSGGDAWG